MCLIAIANIKVKANDMEATKVRDFGFLFDSSFFGLPQATAMLDN